jgi:Rha family phage regulatory protein
MIDEEEAPAPSVSLTIVDGAVTCTSYEIAERFSKGHKEVLRAIDNVREICGIEFDRGNFAQIECLDAKSRKYRAYRMTRDGFTLVCMGFTGAAAMVWKVKYIDAFNAMERELNRLASGADLGSIRSDIETVFALVADIEARALTPPPAKKPAFVPRSMIARRAKRTATRRSASNAEVS